MAQGTAGGGENGRSADTLSTELQRMTPTNPAGITGTADDEQTEIATAIENLAAIRADEDPREDRR